MVYNSVLYFVPNYMHFNPIHDKMWQMDMKKIGIFGRNLVLTAFWRLLNDF